METFLVTGCGVSAICSNRDGVMYWITAMVNKGGIPVITRWISNG